MDRSHRHRTSSPPHLPSTSSSIPTFSDISDVTSERHVFQSEASPSRQQKLLVNRNARFPAKKLSITSLGNKLSQLIGNNDKSDSKNAATRDQENNKLHKSRSTGTIGKRRSLGVLDELSTIGRSRSARRREEIPIYQDHLEAPLLQSPPSASSPYIDPRGDFNSPLGFDHIQDNFDDMRLKELPLNLDWSPAMKSPSLRSKSRKRPLHDQFDTDDYIEHIEKELLQIRDEAYSPLTRRPMKEKLRAAHKENDRLQKELALMREKFETEVKRTVEHTTRAELEMKRKVRDLEVSIEEKDHTIRELQYQHEETRLDNSIITSLKVTIERLEQDKLDMEEINLGMNQRNEVLSKLLAMSPAKLCDGFDLQSPPPSPYGSHNEKPTSVVCSPRALNSADISPFRLSPDGDFSMQSANFLQKAVATPQQELSDPMHRIPSPVHQPKSRRSTLQSDISASSSGVNGIGSFLNEEKGLTRRKARRFMGGSTQLKPLLLPSMTSESISLHSVSTASSPRSWPAETPSEIDADDTILPCADVQEPTGRDPDFSKTASTVFPVDESVAEEGPGPAYTDHRETGFVKSDIHNKLQRFLDDTNTSSQVPSPFIAAFDVDTPLVHASGDELSVEHLKQHNSKYSLQTMPVPETPESLIARPQPLFSASRDAIIRAELASMPSGSPYVPPEGMWQVSVSKKRKPSLEIVDLDSPASKLHCRHQSQLVSADLASRAYVHDIPRSPGVSTTTSSVKQQLSQIRSSDNFVNLLRQKNFAARPLAALTIRTVYTLLSTCTNAVREFRSDPFALARRVLANAWRANWKVFGKVSWWVLGLFIQPEARPKAHAPVDWDLYDGESIASRYCSSVSDDGDFEGRASKMKQESKVSVRNAQNEDGSHAADTTEKSGWGHSMYLWGKFSAALVLAVGGAVIKGPSEMLRETKPSSSSRSKHKHCKSCSKRERIVKVNYAQMQTPVPKGISRSKASSTHSRIDGLDDDRNISDFDFRFQLGSSSLLEQIQQPDDDSTLRPETSRRGRLGSLFSPTPSSNGLVSRMQDLRLYSMDSRASFPDVSDLGSRGGYGG